MKLKEALGHAGGEFHTAEMELLIRKAAWVVVHGPTDAMVEAVARWLAPRVGRVERAEARAMLSDAFAAAMKELDEDANALRAAKGIQDAAAWLAEHREEQT